MRVALPTHQGCSSERGFSFDGSPRSMALAPATQAYATAPISGKTGRTKLFERFIPTRDTLTDEIAKARASVVMCRLAARATKVRPTAPAQRRLKFGKAQRSKKKTSGYSRRQASSRPRFSPIMIPSRTHAPRSPALQSPRSSSRRSRSGSRTTATGGAGATATGACVAQYSGATTTHAPSPRWR